MKETMNQIKSVRLGELLWSFKWAVAVCPESTPRAAKALLTEIFQ